MERSSFKDFRGIFINILLHKERMWWRIYSHWLLYHHLTTIVLKRPPVTRGQLNAYVDTDIYRKNDRVSLLCLYIYMYIIIGLNCINTSIWINTMYCDVYMCDSHISYKWEYVIQIIRHTFIYESNCMDIFWIFWVMVIAMQYWII